MNWTYLGHAMWLVEVEGLRLLFDPLLADTHHCGVYELVPRRRLDEAALRPDVLLISHRHPDHFDVRSLDRLARRFPEAVVLTPDRLVMWAARELGFSRVREVGVGEGIDLEVARLVTTTSLARDEWGAMVHSRHGVVWNQVDTVLRDAAQVKAVTADALAALGADAVDLALVRWQPMYEIAAQLGHRTDFPYETYATLLEQIAAVQAGHVVPSANGAAHAGAFSWLDSLAFPVSPQRFVRDFAEIDPQADASIPAPGDRYRIRDHGVVHERGGNASLVLEVESRPDPRRYHPSSIPPVVDHNPGGYDEAITRPRIRRWIHEDLRDGLARVARGAKEAPLRMLLEVVFESVTERYTLVIDGDGATVHERDEPEWDALNVVAGSLLWEVVQGRRSWGDVLLAGALRGWTRAYRVGAGGLQRLDVASLFVYYGLSYDVSVRRAVAWEVQTVLAQRS